jgi:hypothetical protein
MLPPVRPHRVSAKVPLISLPSHVKLPSIMPAPAMKPEASIEKTT